MIRKICIYKNNMAKVSAPLLTLTFKKFVFLQIISIHENVKKEIKVTFFPNLDKGDEVNIKKNNFSYIRKIF